MTDNVTQLVKHLTPDERLILQRRMDKRIRWLDFHDFRRKMFSRYIELEFQHYIADKMLGLHKYILTDGRMGIPKLMISLPVRHGKTATSRLFIAWMIAEFPHVSVIITSYSADLAKQSSRAVRSIIESQTFQDFYPDVRTNPKKRKEDEWEIEGHGGVIRAIGTDGGILGYGANIVIYDDMLKGRTAANSANIRNRVWEFIQDDIGSRMEYPAVQLFIGTRYHADDMHARFLHESEVNEGESQWENIRLPALAEHNDPLGRAYGEALWADRYPAYRLKLIEQKNPYGFASLYQQSPQRREGNAFDVSKIEVLTADDPLPDILDVVRYWDLALTRGKSSDYTAAVKMGYTDRGTYIILDVFRAKMELPDIYTAIMDHAVEDGTECKIVIEGERGGIAAFDMLKYDKRLYKHIIKLEPMDTTSEKYARNLPFANRVNNGLVSMIQAEWNYDFTDELSMFSQAMVGYDDQVDAASGAYRELGEGTAEGGAMYNWWE